MDEGDRRLGGHVTSTIAVAAVFVVALMLVFAFGQSTPPEPTPSPSPTVIPVTQETLLVQVTLGRTSVASILIATGGDPDQTVLLDLRQDLLLVDGPAYTPLLDANLSLNPKLTVQATANTLGVRVDGGWRMERKALAGVVDSVGTVTVTLAQPQVFLDDLGQPVLSLPAGESKLSGQQASWYALGVIAGEDPVAGIQARTTEVFTKAVQQLPDDAEAIAAMLTSLGSLSDPLNGTSELSEQLVAVREDLVNGATKPLALPMRTSQAADPVVTRQELNGGAAAAVGAFLVADYPTAEPILRNDFALAPRVADVDGPPRVLLWNATGEPLSSHVALLELSDAGFIAMSAGSSSSVQQVTQIQGVGYLLDGQSYTAAVAEALRLTAAQEFGDTGTSPSPTVTASPAPTSTPVPSMPPPDQKPWGDVDVEVGQDYKPCPANDPQCLKELQ